MTKRNRIFIGILLAYALGVGFLLWRLLADIDPRYRESAEESLVETAHLMASLIQTRLPHAGALAATAPDVLEPVFRDLYARRFSADIFGFRKTRVELRLYAVDARGRVIFDSLGRHEGEDYSQWHDVRRTLDGHYGARTSRDVDGDPGTSVMYVAAPIRAEGRIIGAVTVGKPVQSFGQFVEQARRKTLLVGLTSVLAVLFLVVILSVWLARPFGLVADVWRAVRAQKHGGFSLRRMGRRTLGAFGAAFDEMRDALAGRNYVADYVQTLTHELKGPLSAIRGASELLYEPAMPEPDRQRFVSNIQRETLRIQELVDRMMELAALESRRQLERTEPVALRPLLEELAASARAAGAPRGIRVVLEPGEPGAKEAIVEGDPLLLRRAVGNLLDNALDFSPSGGRVTLALETKPRSVDITVRDQGPGIPDYADDKVFERFYSLARPGTQKKSTGLGLAFVKEIAALHRGKVALRNAKDGAGAVATLSLPASGS